MSVIFQIYLFLKILCKKLAQEGLYIDNFGKMRLKLQELQKSNLKPKKLKKNLQKQ